MDEKILKNIPNLPGVYIMKDAAGKVLYIGKALSLKKRVRSYFAPCAGHSPRIEVMVKRAKDIGFFVTATEAEALIQEAAFIKKYRPPYNTALKDDKSYPYLKLGVGEEYPRLEITRKPEDDGSLYYGPYTDVRLLRKALRIMKRLFPLRTCRRMPKKACLNHRIGNCAAPCIGAVDKRGYAQIVKELRLFLEGRKDTLVRELSGMMRKASSARDFERAAELRDRITALSAVPSSGKGSYYTDFSGKKSRRSRGKRYKPYDQIMALRYFLNARRTPKRIEAFDISNIQGSCAVGSMITFIDGHPRKDEYKRFRIEGVKGIDDYAMMREVLRRRYVRVRDERLGTADLIIVDGGKGHLNAVLGLLKELGFERIPVIAIAKRFEHVFVPGRKEPVVFSGNSPVLYLIQRIRDEAHRFAISYHHNIKEKSVKASALDEIRGIGKARKRDLLKRFGSVSKIRNASAKEIARIRGINEKLAKCIKRHLTKAG